MIVVINNCQLIGLKTVRFLKYFSVSQFAAVQGCSGQDLKCLILSLKSQSGFTKGSWLGSSDDISISISMLADSIR